MVFFSFPIPQPLPGPRCRTIYVYNNSLCRTLGDGHIEYPSLAAAAHSNDSNGADRLLLIIRRWSWRRRLRIRATRWAVHSIIMCPSLAHHEKYPSEREREGECEVFQPQACHLPIERLSWYDCNYCSAQKSRAGHGRVD